ncbi:hypothetical protein DSECCO2_521150 [anaerobic digester metagenome]
MSTLMKKVTKIVVLICVLIFLGVMGLLASIQNNRNILPLNLDPFPTINISTPDANNPTKKVVKFEITVVNKNDKPVNVKFYFTKKEGIESWYPYYKIIPDLHETEVYHLEPGQIEEISSIITVETDDNRLVTSQLTDVKCQYKIIE